MGEYVTENEDWSSSEKTKIAAHIKSIFKAVSNNTQIPIKVDESEKEIVKANLRDKISSMMGSNKKKPTPDFAEIFTKNEGLTRNVTEDQDNQWYTYSPSNKRN